MNSQCFLFQEGFPDFSKESTAFVPMPHSVQSPLGRLLCVLIRSVCLSPDLNKGTFEAGLVTCQLPLGPGPSTGPGPNRLWGNVGPVHVPAGDVPHRFPSETRLDDFWLHREASSVIQEGRGVHTRNLGAMCPKLPFFLLMTQALAG